MISNESEAANDQRSEAWHWFLIIFMVLLLNTINCMSQTADDLSVSSLEKQFASSQLPPGFCPTIRYWWLGGAVRGHPYLVLLGQ